MGRELTTVLVQSPAYELQDDRLQPPLGLLYIATWLRSRGHAASIADLSSLPLPEAVAAVPRADVYGFSTYTATYRRTVAIANELRRLHPDAHMVAGGPHASALPEAVLEDFDCVVLGEGEKAMQRLLDDLRQANRPPRLLRGPAIADLDELPFPDYSLVDIKSYTRIVADRRCLSILSSRGCPYRCVFCNSNVMGPSRPVRFRSAEHVVAEFSALEQDWGVRSFRFEDDTFTLNLPRLREITRLLEGRGITYRCFGRADRCTREVTDMLREGGCRHIAFGVESGSPLILERMGKGQTVEQIRSGIGNARASGLVVRVFLLVGFPGETWHTAQATIDLMRECRPDEFIVYPLIPYPGTPLYHSPEEFGITHIDPDFSRYFQVSRGREAGFVFRTRDLDERELGEMRQHVIESLEPEITWAGASNGFK